MKILSDLTESSFKKDSNGNKVFYPWGAMTCGYIIPGDNEHKRVQRFILINYVVSLPVLTLSFVAFGPICLLAVTPLLGLVYWLFVRKLVFNFERGSEKLSKKESVINGVKPKSLLSFLVLFFFSFLLIFMSLYIV